jgi:hypothetical protein
MALSEAGIPWWACDVSGNSVGFQTVSESGIRLLISDYPRTTETGVMADGRIVLVTSLEAAQAALAQTADPVSDVKTTTKNPIESGLESGIAEAGARVRIPGMVIGGSRRW